MTAAASTAPGAEKTQALEARARELGYIRARLDTGDRQPAAARLYDDVGYRRIADYNGNRLARLWFEREL